MAELIINASLPETRIALLEDGEIQELLIERDAEQGIVGNIYKGKVTRVLPGMQAAFVDIGLEKAAFLYVDDIYLHNEWVDEDSEIETDEEEVRPIPKIIPKKNPISQLETIDSDETEKEQGSEVHASSENGSEESVQNETQNDGFVESTSEETVDLKSESDDSADEGETPVELAAEEKTEESLVAEEVEVIDEKTHQSEDLSAVEAKELKRKNAQFREIQEEAFTRNQAYQDELMDDPADHEADRWVLAAEEEAQEDEIELEEDDEYPLAPLGPKTSEMEVRQMIQREAVTKVRGPNPELRKRRPKDRRLPAKSSRPVRQQVNIQDILKEGQEVMVQVAKDPIATKGARLTCHVTLPGRHLVCMPTISHVGVSRRIEKDDERRRLREFVNKNRPKTMGFIVRTASSGKDLEMWIKQDIDYLSSLWTDIMNRAQEVQAPGLVYQDLNTVVRAVRDWVDEGLKKVVIDSRAYYDQTREFVTRFMPNLEGKVEYYQGDIPIFDAYGISTELHRALEKRVWLKSGGYIVIDQAEALVAIDVNTGRFVGKKNLEDTILKTNLEAVQEIAYQLRLRNLGGIIIIDVIDMERDENKQRVLRALEEAIKVDRARPTIVKLSELGLIEMTRKRTRDSMVRSMCSSCYHCEGKGFVKNAETVAFEVMRELEREGLQRDIKKVLVQAHPDVIDYLAIDARGTVDYLEKHFHKQFYLQPVTDFHIEQFEVSVDRAMQMNDRSGQKIPSPGQTKNARARRPNARNGARKNRGDNRGDRPAKKDAPQSARAQGAEERAECEESITQIRPKIVSPVERSSDVSEKTEKARSAIKPRDPGTPAPKPRVSQAPRSGEMDADEEDRLAFLRAQAAQDAALANFGTSNSPSATYGESSDVSRSNGRNNPRGRNGGRGTGGHGPGKNRNPRNNNARRGGRRGPGLTPNQNRNAGPSFSGEGQSSAQDSKQSSIPSAKEAVSVSHSSSDSREE
jgi:ribonuclease G